MSVHAANNGTGTTRVLIVDDDAIVLTVLRDFFASFRHGHAYEITIAESTSEAFQILRREQFDLIPARRKNTGRSRPLALRE